MLGHSLRMISVYLCIMQQSQQAEIPDSTAHWQGLNGVQYTSYTSTKFAWQLLGNCLARLCTLCQRQHIVVVDRDSAVVTNDIVIVDHCPAVRTAANITADNTHSQILKPTHITSDVKLDCLVSHSHAYLWFFEDWQGCKGAHLLLMSTGALLPAAKQHIQSSSRSIKGKGE